MAYSDWNDLHVHYGLDEVKRQINNALEAANDKSGADELPPVENYRDELPAQTEPPLGADEAAQVIDPNFDFTNDIIRHDYVVLSGKGACIFNDRTCQMMSRQDFSLSVGEGPAKAFLNDNSRRVVYRHNVVFDPTTIEQEPGFINLFRGLKLKPKKGECSKILSLLRFLCEDNEEVFTWLLRWLAYPLQNPGAKMRTALVIHGREGTGKNLFFRPIQQIYGEYATIITQTELESSFNSWASRKLFIIGNEVTTRQEMYHKKGVVKNMITEPEWNINQKNIDIRQENNHANFVFFSNFLQPVAPDRDDRRWMVLWTPPKREKAFYREVVAEIENGGTEALYDYLLNLDVGEFDEFTEPVMTKAKQDLIDLSMKSDERFLHLWTSCELNVPLIPCLTEDLYKVYLWWCKHEGERFSVGSTEFGIQIGKHEELDKKSHQHYMDGSKKRTNTFAFPLYSEPPADMTKIKWLTSCRTRFVHEFTMWLDNEA